MRKIIFLIFFVISANLYSSVKPTTNVNDTVVIGSLINFAPFQFLNKDSKVDGFDIELLTTILKQRNINYKLESDYWTNLSRKFRNKKIDIVVHSGFDNLVANYPSSIPIDSISRVILYHKKNSFRNIDDIKDKKIIIIKDTWAESFVSSNKVSEDIITVNDVNDGIKMILMGICDALLISEQSASIYIEQYKIQDLCLAKINETSPSIRRVYVSEESLELIKILNEGLYSLMESGEYQAIYNKWFNKTKTPKISSDAYKIIYILIFVGLILTVWIVILFRNLSRKNDKINDLYSDMILAVDSGGIILWTLDYKTKKFDYLHKYKDDYPIAKTLDEFLESIPEKSRARIFDIIDDFEKLKISKASMAFPMIFKEKRIYAEINMRSIAKDGFLQNIVGTFKDYTERYTREIELRDAKSKLEDFKYRIERTINNSDIVIMEYNTISNKLKFINSPIYKENEGIIIESMTENLHPGDVDKFLSAVDKMKFGNSQNVTFDFRIRYSDNQDYINKRISFKPYEKNNNIYTKYIGLSSDISNIPKKSTEEFFKNPESEPETTLFGQDYLANITHEIRTPLNAIVGFSDLICEADSEDEKIMFMDYIKSNSDLLLKLLSDLFELSRFEAGVFDYTLSEFSINRMCKEVYDENYYKTKNDVTLIIDRNKQDFLVNSDKKRIKQVLSNIVLNAIKYTDEGSICIKSEKIDNYIKITVADTGHGLTEESKASIFNKYGNSKSLTSNSELSLSISKYIIETLGGKIGVDSEFRKGSEFWFIIPIKQEDAVCNISEYKVSQKDQINA